MQVHKSNFEIEIDENGMRKKTKEAQQKEWKTNCITDKFKLPQYAYVHK